MTTTDGLFDIFAPLPAANSITMLEASAGTGKTYTLSFLVARFVAEGADLKQILAVTFTRRASVELRDGIRNMLGSFYHGYDRFLAGDQSDRSIEPSVAQLLSAYPSQDWHHQRERIANALAELDAAPIFTLHTFAKRILDELGFLADHDPATPVSADTSTLQQEVIHDCYLSDYRPGSGAPRLAWDEALHIGQAALANSADPLYPVDPSEPRYVFAQAVRAEFAARKRARQVMNYDDMITRLVAALENPKTGGQAAEILRGRFSLVLIDEFQDTDPGQWHFLSRAFVGHVRLIMIGDPKQAIYRFRGGDVETYLAARAQSQVKHLGTNHRSDAAVVNGIAALFGNTSLASGDQPIVLSQVHASNENPRVKAKTPIHPVQIRALAHPKTMSTSGALAAIAADLIERIERMISDWRIDSGGWRAVNHGDIAILVHTNWAGEFLRERLRSAGYPVVFSGESSVYASAAADELLRFLVAVTDTNPRAIRRAALTTLLGWTSADLAAENGQMAGLTEMINRCARIFAEHGITGVFEEFVSYNDGYARILQAPDGEEHLTNLRHLVQLLNEEQHRSGLSNAALVDYLRSAIEHRSTADAAERMRRIPTDRPAIQILTIHQAKGLQFPIVLVPQATLSAPFPPNQDACCLGHIGTQRVLDLGTGAGRADRFAHYHAEELAESLRVLYVAFTRAQSVLITWWAPVRSWAQRRSREVTSTSGLHRLIHAQGSAGIPAATFPCRDAHAVRATVAATLASRGVAAGSVAVDVIDPRQIPPIPTGHSAPTQAGEILAAADFVDTIDRDWQRTSFSGLTSGLAHTQRIDFDEPSADQETSSLSNDDGLTGLPGGVEFGTLVHEILEAIDPADADLTAGLATLARQRCSRLGLEIDPITLAQGLEKVLTTPLGVPFEGQTLRDFGITNRLAELDFEMSLGADHRWRLADLAGLFGDLDSDDPLSGYGDYLASSPAAQTVLSGFMVGSIDAVLRTPAGRYAVVDYKTNRIPLPLSAALEMRHYHPDAMCQVMISSHYPLQALIYSVALHRYLAWRLPGYDPQVHLGPVGYLFVRGMAGADNPIVHGMPQGVFTWQPPVAMITAAADLMGGRAK